MATVTYGRVTKQVPYTGLKPGHQSTSRRDARWHVSISDGPHGYDTA